jgi:hypothetical protein
MTLTVIAVLALAAVVFGTSAGAKLRGRAAYAGFVAGLGESGLIAIRFLPAVAAVLAGAEVLIAVGATATAGYALAAEPPAAAALARIALLAAALLAGALSAGVAVLVRRGTRARCACFGSSSARPLGAQALARNLALLVVFVAGFLASVPSPQDPAIAGSLVALAGGGITGLLLVHLDDLVELFGGSPGAGLATTRATGSRERRPG